MTLALVLACKDGIVLAADSQETYANLPLMRRDKHRPKIIKINDSIMIAGAGSVNFLQQVEEELRAYIATERLPQNEGCLKIKEKVQLMVHATRKNHLERMKALYGNETALQLAPSGQLIMASHDCDSAPKLNAFLIDGDGDIERITTYQPIGSGMLYAELILKDYYHPDLTTEDGKRLAYWTVSDTKEVDNNVGPPIVIATITEKGANYVSESEVEALEEAYQIKKNTLREIFGRWSELGPKILKLLKPSNKSLSS